MMGWNAFGVVAACLWGGLLLAIGVGKISSLRLCGSARNKNTLAVLLLMAVIATVEAQKQGQLRIENEMKPTPCPSLKGREHA